MKCKNVELSCATTTLAILTQVMNVLMEIQLLQKIVERETYTSSAIIGIGKDKVSQIWHQTNHCQVTELLAFTLGKVGENQRLVLTEWCVMLYFAKELLLLVKYINWKEAIAEDNLFHTSSILGDLAYNDLLWHYCDRLSLSKIIWSFTFLYIGCYNLTNHLFFIIMSIATKLVEHIMIT